MIPEKFLKTCDNISGVYERVQANGSGGLQPLIQLIQKSMADERQNIKLINEQIQFGSFFNKSYEDCVVMQNAEHGSNYYQFVFSYRVSKNGNEYYYIYSMGNSHNFSMRDTSREIAAEGGFLNGIVAKLNKPKKDDILEEEEYYEAVNKTLRLICGS